MANNVKEKAVSLINNVKYYWSEPPKGRYMPFKEIAAYSFGGIGAYLIIGMSGTCLLSTTNVFVSGTLGISPTHMYVLYVLAVLAGIPLTGVRANIIDNTRNKAGKYRPYLLTMGIPSALLFVGMVWFPYNKLELIVGNGEIFGQSAYYVAKCAVILLFNLALQFFYYFYYDSYENLIHVLSPNSQERSDVVAIKSVVYSLGPSIIKLVMPLIAQNIFHTNNSDVRVYKLAFPIFGIVGSLMLSIVYANTQEKIVQARTHVIQIKFTDALREVAKNKYFWIISLAGWIGFLESAFGNIMYWLYNYGGACSGNEYSIIVTLYGNASLWGMLLAPFCIRKWGKRNVKIVTNLLNIVFILAMLLFTKEINASTIWLVLMCLYLNAAVGAFAHILDPSMQADIRDYQQYKTGERIDGMFAAVLSIGNIITLATSSVLPAIYEKLGMTVENAKVVLSNSEVLNRLLPFGENGSMKTVGDILTEQVSSGQEMYTAANALYDVDNVLLPLIHSLIIISAIGATLNVLPLFFYDLSEIKQKSIVRVLKIRAGFEDYGNDALSDKDLVEMIDLISDSREKASMSKVVVSKDSYKNAPKGEKKAEKKKYKEAKNLNDEIEISKLVCEELDKFDGEFGEIQLNTYKEIYDAGFDSVKSMNIDDVKAQLKDAKALPKNTKEEKKVRAFLIEIAKTKLSALKTYNKHYGSVKEFVQPDVKRIDEYFEIEDMCDEQLRTLNIQLKDAKKDKNKAQISTLKKSLKEYESKRKSVRKASKELMDEQALFNRAAKHYVDAKKALVQYDNYNRFDNIKAKYDDAKVRVEEQEKIDELARQQRIEEQQKELEERKAKKAEKKNKNK